MTNYSKKVPSFFEVLVGIIMAPNETVQRLFTVSRPVHVLKIFLLLYFIIATPPFIQFLYHINAEGNNKLLLASFICPTLAIILFIIFEYIVLRALQYKTPLRWVTACIMYSIVPLLELVLLIYALNYITNNNATAIGITLNGLAKYNSIVKYTIPWLLILAPLFSIYIFIISIRALTGLYFISATFFSALSVFPLGLAVGISLIVCKILIPDTLITIKAFLGAPLAFFGL